MHTACISLCLKYLEQWYFENLNFENVIVSSTFSNRLEKMFTKNHRSKFTAKHQLQKKKTILIALLHEL